MSDANMAAVERDNALIRKAVAAERERCAKIAETEEEAEGEPDAKTLDAMNLIGPIENARAAIRATKKSIAKRIRSNQ